MAESKALKSLLMKVKEEREKVGLKLKIQKTKIMASCPITSWLIDRKTVETGRDFIFLGSKITADGDCSHEIKRRLLLERKCMTNRDSILKAETLLCQQSPSSQSMVFPVVVYGCESWTIKKAEHQRICFWIVVLQKTLESPLDCKEIQPVHSEGDQPWVFIARGTDAEAETPILWPPDAKNWLIGKDPDAGKDWRREEKGTTEGEMVGWHHWLDGHGFRWTLQVGDGQGGLVCCGSWGHKESDTTEWLSWTDIYWKKTHVNGLTQSKLMLFEGQLWPVLLKQAVNMPSPPGQPGPLCHACSLCALHYFVSRRTLPGLSVPNK